MARAYSFIVIAALLAAGSAFAQDGRAPLGTPGTVTLSRAEYDRLVDLASEPRVATDQPPVAAALTRAEIRVRVDAAARATMRLDGQVFRQGVSKLTLIAGAVLLDARMENRPLPVAAENGTHVAFVTGPSTFSATLDVGSPLTFTPGRAAFQLPVPNAGAATATIDIPGEQADVRLSTGLILRRQSANGRTIVDATLTPGTQTSVSWSTHEVALATVAARELRVLSDVKSILSIGDAELRLICLVTATVVAGEPSQLAVSIPPGFDVASVSGSSLERSDTAQGGLVLHLSDPTLRRHQFLLSLERAQSAGSFTFNTGFPTVRGAQRETGEVAIEGSGTLNVTAPESPGLRRIDVRELDPSLTSVARDALLAAYRYQATAEGAPMLALDVHRYADAPVLSAVAERAMATTLVTVEGRALTEITLWLRNRAQRYMKVDLPQGASIVSVEVDGSPAKPVEGTDGSRIPLVRARPARDGLYTVSFVYLHAGTPFVKKGDAQTRLPKMDVPIDVLEWELFVPEQFKVDHFDGNLIDASLISALPPITAASVGGGSLLLTPQTGQIAGVVVDQTGAAIPGAQVTLTSGNYRQTVTTDGNGNYIASNVPSGAVTITTGLPGFQASERTVQFAQVGQRADATLKVAGVAESVTVHANSPVVDAKLSATAKKDESQAPSVNVQNLQRRASGVLPVRIDVPRAGTEHRFVKPLVIEEETEVTFRYRRR